MDTYQPEETSKNTKMTLLDKGRLEVVADSDREIAPEDAASPREGCEPFDIPIRKYFETNRSIFLIDNQMTQTANAYHCMLHFICFYMRVGHPT